MTKKKEVVPLPATNYNILLVAAKATKDLVAKRALISIIVHGCVKKLATPYTKQDYRYDPEMRHKARAIRSFKSMTYMDPEMLYNTAYGRPTSMIHVYLQYTRKRIGDGYQNIELRKPNVTVAYKFNAKVRTIVKIGYPILRKYGILPLRVEYFSSKDVQVQNEWNTRLFGVPISDLEQCRTEKYQFSKTIGIARFCDANADQKFLDINTDPIVYHGFWAEDNK